MEGAVWSTGATAGPTAGERSWRSPRRGVAALQGAAPAHAEAVRQAFFDRLSREQVQAMTAICTSVLDGLVAPCAVAAQESHLTCDMADVTLSPMDLRLPVEHVAVPVLAGPPAGGAALHEVIGATAGVGVVTLLLLGLAIAHRTRRTTVLVRLAEALGRRTGRPGWAALPTLLTTASLLTALFGMLWDISLHIGEGRDEGPLANPAHYFILVGLFLVFTAGMTRGGAPAATSIPVRRRCASPGPGGRRSAVCSSRAPASTPCWASRWTTSGTACSGRTSRCGGRRT